MDISDKPSRVREPGLPTEPPLPVVARLVVEIRSDGSRTVARGALVDADGEGDVAVAVEASTPAALWGQLARTLLTLPTMLRRARSDEGPPGGPRRSLRSRIRKRLGGR